MTELVIVDDVAPAAFVSVQVDRASTASSVLQAAMTGRRSTETARAYAGDLKQFFAWRGLAVDEDALLQLCSLNTAQTSQLLNEYLLSMRAAGLKPNTINRRLSAVRTLIRIARRFGLTEVDPTGLVDNEKTRRYRDVRGPSIDEVVSLMRKPDRKTLIGKRDYALLRLLWENILRRSEICAANIEHFDAKRRQLAVYRKGYGNELTTVQLSKRCVAAIDDYLEARTGGRRLDNGEPLFLNHSHSRPGRLKSNGLYYVLGEYGRAVLKRRISPHKLRHSGATAYARETGDMRGLQKLGGWADLRTAERYLDDGEELQGKATETLSKLA